MVREYSETDLYIFEENWKKKMCEKESDSGSKHLDEYQHHKCVSCECERMQCNSSSACLYSLSKSLVRQAFTIPKFERKTYSISLH